MCAREERELERDDDDDDDDDLAPHRGRACHRSGAGITF